MADCKILRPLRFSRDGITSIEAAVGTVADIPERLITGLVADGYLSRVVHEQAVAGPLETAIEPPMETPKPAKRRGRPAKVRK